MCEEADKFKLRRFVKIRKEADMWQADKWRDHKNENGRRCCCGR
jgi:hypothetical protein